jgi:hypothetical protein
MQRLARVVTVCVGAMAAASACLLPSFDDVRATGAKPITDGSIIPDSAVESGVDAGLPGCDVPDPFPASLRAYWPMTEGAGTTISDCKGLYPGTFKGNVGWTNGRNGLPALDMKGGYVLIGGPNDLAMPGDFTIAVWFSASMNQTDAFGDIVARYSSLNNAAFDLTVAQNPQPSVSLSFFQGGIVQVTAPIADNTLLHVVTTYTSSTGGGEVYLNGSIAQTGTGTKGLAAVQVPLTIGANATGTSVFQGKIAGVRVYNRVLTSIEIGQLALFQH